MNDTSTRTGVITVRLVLVSSCVACCFCLFSTNLLAEVVFEWATVGNPNNPPDQYYPANNIEGIRFGAVDYIYRIGRHEVTNDQYREFLNAVDPTGMNPHDVYHLSMGTNERGGIAFDDEAVIGAKYSCKANMGNKPVNYVSFFDAMRFVNWMENGQPIDGSGTERGVYAIGTGASESRAAGARYFIPSEDEWYKAAYYDPRSEGEGGPSGDDHYWLYPTSSDAAPTVATASATGDISNPGPNVANYFSGADWNGQNGNVTTVGSAGAGSTSFYGTFDQAGNVAEWNESIRSWYSDWRGVRGGYWVSGANGLAAWEREVYDPTGGLHDVGFRVAGSLSAWHNVDDPLDVNGLDGVQPLDALLVINELNVRRFSDRVTGLLTLPATPPPFLDVNNDLFAAPLDALWVINGLPSTPSAASAALASGASDEHVAGFVPVPEPVGVSWLFLATTVVAARLHR